MEWKIRSECDCPCHKSDNSIVHCVPCCNEYSFEHTIADWNAKFSNSKIREQKEKEGKQMSLDEFKQINKINK